MRKLPTGVAAKAGLEPTSPTCQAGEFPDYSISQYFDFGSGNGIRTRDLQLMRLASWPAALSRSMYKFDEGTQRRQIVVGEHIIAFSHHDR